jgi:hypothetical protein
VILGEEALDKKNPPLRLSIVSNAIYHTVMKMVSACHTPGGDLSGR